MPNPFREIYQLLEVWKNKISDVNLILPIYLRELRYFTFINFKKYLTVVQYTGYKDLNNLEPSYPLTGIDPIYESFAIISNTV